VFSIERIPVISTWLVMDLTLGSWLPQQDEADNRKDGHEEAENTAEEEVIQER
jgi:hypothetical protein